MFDCPTAHHSLRDPNSVHCWRLAHNLGWQGPEFAAVLAGDGDGGAVIPAREYFANAVVIVALELAGFLAVGVAAEDGIGLKMKWISEMLVC